MEKIKKISEIIFGLIFLTGIVCSIIILITLSDDYEGRIHGLCGKYFSGSTYSYNDNECVVKIPVTK